MAQIAKKGDRDCAGCTLHCSPAAETAEPYDARVDRKRSETHVQVPAADRSRHTHAQPPGQRDRMDRRAENDAEPHAKARVQVPVPAGSCGRHVQRPSLQEVEVREILRGRLERDVAAAATLPTAVEVHHVMVGQLRRACTLI